MEAKETEDKDVAIKSEWEAGVGGWVGVGNTKYVIVLLCC